MVIFHPHRNFQEKNGFEELALYAEGVIHHSTLSARTFSEVLTLDQQDGLMGWHPGFPEGKEVKQVGDSD